MNLIQGWEKAYKLSSVQLGTAAVIVQAADQWLPAVSAFLPPWLSGVLTAAAVIARLIAQPKLDVNRNG
ncbi:hypothetical protein [Pseudomonas sp. BF-R-21]|uniref:DUF7940 domain-containing protein n=1 Tax=Pseudomonas sp. BF-R-21 TaxID=2832387 RepID=UPI001CC1323F|nr:hypothetical protein [Pseudomonas sp. BF-R-21]